LDDETKAMENSDQDNDVAAAEQPRSAGVEAAIQQLHALFDKTTHLPVAPTAEHARMLQELARLHAPDRLPETEPSDAGGDEQL
jgi:hypothetical protein